MQVMAGDACSVIDRQLHVIEPVEVVGPVRDSVVIELGMLEMVPASQPRVRADGLAVDGHHGVAAEAVLEM